MRHCFTFAVLSFLLLSCKSHTRPPVPANIAQPDSMVLLLTDVHVMQASLQLGYIQNDSANSVQKAFQTVWKKHHMTEEDYNRNIKFYSAHPDLLDSVYEKVLNNLGQQKAELLGKKHS